MEDQQHKDLVNAWLARSRGKQLEYSELDRFVALWFAFNAWAMYRTDALTDRQMIEKIGQEDAWRDRHLKLIRNQREYNQRVRELQDACPVLDVRRSRSSSKSISNPNNWSEVLKVIYQVRCNLFHGRKSPDSERDRLLVHLAYGILSKVFNPAKLE